MRWRGWEKHIDPAVWPGALICVAYTCYGLGMVLQPARFLSTPAYGNLTQVLDIRVWGLMYLVSAALFAVYTVLVTNRAVGVVVHVVGLIVTMVWLMAFVVRWLTDENTTVVNVASWLVLTLVIARSATLIPVAQPPRGEP